MKPNGEDLLGDPSLYRLLGDLEKAVAEQELSKSEVCALYQSTVAELTEGLEKAEALGLKILSAYFDERS